MKITGEITKILDVQSGTTDRGDWKKINFLVDTKEEYNNLYYFTLFGAEKVDNFQQYNKVGDKVDVSFNVQTREWEGKYFTDLQAWKVFKAQEDKVAEISSGNDSLPF